MAAPTARGSRGPVPDRDPERLVRTYADLVLRVCFTYLRSTADAEDICQDTLVKLIARPGPFESLEHERAWIIRVAANACKDLLRRVNAHPRIPLENIPEPTSAPMDEEELVRQRDQQVLSAVMALPLPQREAVYLHYYEGYRARDIARITGATEAAVLQRLSRARRQLKKTLKGAYDDFPA